MQMTDEKKRRSVIMLVLELVKDIIVFMNIELNLAKAEVKKNIAVAKQGIILALAGSCILFLALFVLLIAGIAALDNVLPLWLALLLVAVFLAFIGAALLFSGKTRLKDSFHIPTKTYEQVKLILKKLAKK
jgi:hypothetical protein